MKKILLLSACIILSACSGTRPSDIGFNNDRLLPCPDKPNCVSSYEPADDETHYIAPIAIKDISSAKKQIIALIESTEGAEVIKAENNYIYAEYTSGLMGFVDDVEFYLLESKMLVHVRSASRLGYSDLGVNRERIEAIRAAIK